MTCTPPRRVLLGLAACAGLGASLGACVSVEKIGDDKSHAAAVCPDPHRPLPFPIVRPDCWDDDQWALYLAEEMKRSKDGTRRYQTDF